MKDMIVKSYIHFLFLFEVPFCEESWMGEGLYPEYYSIADWQMAFTVQVIKK